MSLVSALLLIAAERKIVSPPGAAVAGPYSPGILAGDFLYVSGQGARNAEGKFAATIEQQIAACLKNVQNIVEAAGLTMEASRLPELAERFNAVVRACVAPEDLVPELRVDLEVPLPRVTGDLETLLRHFEPYGVGNPAPVLVSRGVKVTVPPRLVGEHGVKFRLGDGPAELEGVWWAAADRAPEFPAGSAVDIAYRLERDTYRGTSRLVARLADVRR